MLAIENFGYRIPVRDALGWRLDGTTLGTTLAALAFDDAVGQEVTLNGRPITQAFIKPEITVAVCAMDNLDYFEVRLIPYIPEVELPLSPEEQEKIATAEVARAAAEAEEERQQEAEAKLLAAEAEEEKEARMLLGLVDEEEADDEERLQEAAASWDLVDGGFAW